MGVELLSDVKIIVRTTREGVSIRRFQMTPDDIDYDKLEDGALLTMDESCGRATMIIEFYFGAQLAKGK